MCDRMPGPPPPKRLRISELNPHLLCALCGGYLIDATTIIECLHSFCKTCILRYLETSNYCPICEVLIHKTRPWQNIRLDHSLQNAVYKMVPGLFQNEMRRRREFYEKQNVQDKRGRPNNLPQGELGDRIIFSHDEEFSISIEFSPDGKPNPVLEVKEIKTKSLKRTKVNCQPDKRYLKCPAGLRIEHLKKFIRSKFSLPQTVEVDLFCESELLSETFSLMDVAYIYSWKRDCVLRLFYSFYEIPSKLRKVETVTNVTEISKSKMSGDKSEEKTNKRNDDKKPKGKREKSREKKQSKLSGKRKVSSECAASSICSSTLNSLHIVGSEFSQVDSIGKCPESDTFKNVKSVEKTSTLEPERCSSINGHTTFQQLTKDKTAPESTYSVIAPSRSTDIDRLSKSQDSLTCIKLLIKSSDNKDCKTHNNEILPVVSDSKHHLCEVPSKMKIKKYQNGETKSISKSNLFEKMDSFARSSQAELKEITVMSDCYSSHTQSLSSNSKKLKEIDIKYDIKPNVSITKPKTTIVSIQPVDKLKSESVAFSEEAIQQGAQSQAVSSSTGQIVVDIKPKMCDVKNNKESLKMRDVTCRDKLVVEMKPTQQNTTQQNTTQQNTTVASTNINQNISNTNKTLHVATRQEVQLSNTGETRKTIAQKVIQNQVDMQSTQQDIVGFIHKTRDANQNEAKQGSLENTDSLNSCNENNSKMATCDTVVGVLDHEQLKATEVGSQNCDDTKQNSSKQLLYSPKQRIINPKQKNVQQIIDGNKQLHIDNAEQTIQEAKPNFDHSLAVSPKTSIIFSTPVTTQKIQNGVANKIETSSVQMTVSRKTPKIPDSSVVSKIVIDAAESHEPLYSQSHGSVRLISMTRENYQQLYSTSAQKQTVANLSSEIPVSKPVSLSSSSSATPTATSAITKIRINSSHQTTSTTNGTLLVSSLKQPLISEIATTISLLSPLPAAPKLLKTAVTPASSSCCLSTSYSIASIVSIPAAITSSITMSSVIGKSVGYSTCTTSTTSSTAKVSRSCDVTSTVLAKCTTTVSKNTLTAPLISVATSSSTASSLISKVKDLNTYIVKGKDAESNPASLAPQEKLPDTTSSPSDIPSRINSSFVPTKDVLDATTTAPTIVPSIAVSVTTPLTPSSTVTSTIVAPGIASSVKDTWSTCTTVNVANTFLQIPLTESSALKETQTRMSTGAAESSASNMIKPKEAIKLDNFLFDTRSSEIDSPSIFNNPKLKDSCTVLKQAQKSPIRTKPNSSTQLHGLTNDKSSKHTVSQITAIHHLPKTISQTSKPYSVARSMSVSSTSATKCNNTIQTTKISTLIPRSNSISSRAGTFPKSFSYPATINNVPSSKGFLHASLASHVPRSQMSAVINGSSDYERAMLTKTTVLPSSMSLQTLSPATSHHRTPSSSKHSSKDSDSKMEKTQKNKSIPPLTIPKSCLIGTTLKLQRSPGSTDHYIFAPLTQYGPTSHHNGERSKTKEVKHNGSRTQSMPPNPKDSVFMGERQRVPTIKISDINRNPIIVESGASGHDNSNRHHSPYRSYSHGSSRSSSSENGSARTHSRGGSDSSSPTGSSDKSDRSPARDTRRPSDSELLMSQHWHGYSAADLLFNGFKLPTHPKFHDLHYDTDAMPLDYSQSSSKS